MKYTINEEACKKMIQSNQLRERFITLIRKGYTSQQLVEALGCNRQLADYYVKALTLGRKE